MKVLSYSDRVYYHTLGSDSVYIRNDLHLYNKMVHTAYKMMYDMEFNGARKINASKLEQAIKKKFQTSDYFPLSAIREAQGIMSSNVETYKLRITAYKDKVKQMEMKLEKLQKELDELLKRKNENRTKQLTIYEYLDEVNTINPKIKLVKHKMGKIKGRLHDTKGKLYRIEHNKRPSCCFGGKKLFKGQYTLGLTHEEWYKRFDEARNKRMKITGRRQAKYSNNIFYYDVVEEVMTYRVSSNGVKHTTVVKFPLKFHYHRDALQRAIQLPYNTAGKAVCYELEDYGEYFIIKAIIEVDEDVVKLSSKDNGVVGIDINVDHIMLCDIDSKGNIVGFKKIEYSLDNKSQNQRLHILRNVFSNAFEYAIEVGKPICMEDLDFSYKKRSMMYGNKKMNRMLSCFAYQKMKEISKSCSYHKRIGIIEVNPAYTSQIGRKKYMKIKGANVHMCASYVIGRKGMGYKE